MLSISSKKSATCPRCNSLEVNQKQLFFQGIHILRDSICNKCLLKFYQTLPVGHDALFPTQFSKDGEFTVFVPSAKDWLALPLIRSMTSDAALKAEFKVNRRQKFKDIVLVNCLDSCFGHVFTKLWNSVSLVDRHPELGVIVLISSQCEWLVPDQVAEIWLVDLPVKNCNKKIEGLDTFVQDELKHFETVYLSEAYTHLDHQKIDLEKLLKTPRFNLDEFNTKKPKICFVLRGDRFWHNSRPLNLLYLTASKFGFQKYISPIFGYRQMRLIKRTVELIQQQIPEVEIVLTGFGKAVKNSKIKDPRIMKIESQHEVQRNEIYSQTHLIIGIHGSHMLVPSALTAGFIDLIPAYKLPHIVEDTVLPYKNRLLQFLGRFLDEYSSPKTVANHAISIFREFPYIHQNTIQQPE